MASWLRTGKEEEAGAAFHAVYQAQLSKLDLAQVARAT